MSNQLHPAI